ncbi:MAG: hypothetical protein HY682_02600 [Chloroflexi bacterium]|nr:hypothetical protein [Chloroflexota bacterium]
MQQPQQADTTLEGVIHAAIRAGRIGRPSAVRWLTRHTGQDGDIHALVRARRAVGLWFGSEPAGVHKAGKPGTGHAVETLTWSTGEVAVIVVTPASRFAADDLVVVGSRGVLHYETPVLHSPEAL